MGWLVWLLENALCLGASYAAAAALFGATLFAASRHLTRGALLEALRSDLGAPARRDRWMGFVAWSLFLGTKYTGLFHLALFAPYLCLRAAVEVAARPPASAPSAT